MSVAQCLEAGVLRARVGRLADAGVLIRVARGVYDVAEPELARAPGTPLGRFDRARRRAAVFGPLYLGPGAVVTGVCALVLLGVRGAPQRIRPEVALAHGGGPGTSVGVRVRRVKVSAVRRVNGFDVVVPELALAQTIGEVDRMTAVAMLDSARNQRVLTEAAFARAREMARGRRGVARTWSWWDLSDRRSESPAETHARLTCADAGYPPDVVQLTIRDASGAFLARADQAWRLPDGRWLLGEIDGVEFHAGRRDVGSDLRRQNKIVTDRTILRRWTGREARDGTVAREAAAILRSVGWRRPASPPPMDTLVLPTSVG